MDVREEINRIARQSEERYGPYTSSHEAFGVLAEEVSELLDAIRENDCAGVRDEAIDVAAVALRLAEVVDSSFRGFHERSGFK